MKVAPTLASHGQATISQHGEMNISCNDAGLILMQGQPFRKKLDNSYLGCMEIPEDGN
jgi:hypothetical protein